MFNEAVDAVPKGCELELVSVPGGWLARLERNGCKWAAKDITPLSAVRGAIQMMKR